MKVYLLFLRKYILVLILYSFEKEIHFWYSDVLSNLDYTTVFISPVIAFLLFFCSYVHVLIKSY